MKTVRLTSFNDNVQAHMLQDILKNEGIESMSLNPDTVVDTWRRLAK